MSATQNKIQELFNKVLQRTVNPRWPGGFGDSDHHLMTMFSIAIQMRSKKILELGVRDGTTTEPLLCASAMLNGHLTSVDIENPPSWKVPKELQKFHSFIKSDAIEFLEKEVSKKTFNPLGIPAYPHYDIVYIDDWHSYEHVKKELELIDKLTNKSSIIMLHDLMVERYADGICYNAPGEYYNCVDSEGEFGHGGPTRAVLELDKNKWEWVTLPINNGLTILRKIHNNSSLKNIINYI